MTTAPLTALRPQRLPELLDQAFRLYRQNFLTFVGIMAVAQIPLIVLQAVNVLAVPNSFTSLTALLINLAHFVLIQCLAYAALVRASADNYLGQHFNVLETYRRVGSSWPLVLTSEVLGVLTIAALFIWWLVPLVGWLTGLGIIYFFFAVLFRLLIPIVILEERAGGAAFRRSWDLARRRFWWLVGFIGILILMRELTLIAPSFLVSTLIGWLFRGSTLAESSLPQWVLPLILTVLVILMEILYLPLELIANTLVYFDLRIRTEGFDLAFLANEAATENFRESSRLPQAPPPENTSIISYKDLANFVGLSLLLAIFVGAILAFRAVPIADLLH